MDIFCACSGYFTPTSFSRHSQNVKRFCLSHIQPFVISMYKLLLYHYLFTGSKSGPSYKFHLSIDNWDCRFNRLPEKVFLEDTSKQNDFWKLRHTHFGMCIFLNIQKKEKGHNTNHDLKVFLTIPNLVSNSNVFILKSNLYIFRPTC